MTPRLSEPFKLKPDLTKAMAAVEVALGASALDARLLEMVKLRASQINACAFCVHLHGTTLRKLGESELRILLLDAWRESHLYSERERAALAWTEALTRLAETNAPDEDYAALKANFTDEEQVALTYAIGVINVWNRLQVGFRSTHP